LATNESRLAGKGISFPRNRSRLVGKAAVVHGERKLLRGKASVVDDERSRLRRKASAVLGELLPRVSPGTTGQIEDERVAHPTEIALVRGQRGAALLVVTTASTTARRVVGTPFENDVKESGTSAGRIRAHPNAMLSANV
jgi:hypothetical protein